MKTKHISKRLLSLLLTLLMVFSIFPTSVFAAQSVTIDMIVVQYVDNDWKILYPAGDSTSLTVTSDDAPTLYDAMLAADDKATTDPIWGIGQFFGLEPDMYGDDMPMWYCEVGGALVFDSEETLATGNKVLFYYMGYSAPEPDWDELAGIIAARTEPEPEPEPGTSTVTADIIAARLGYDGWEILYPKTVGGATGLSVSGLESGVTLYDAMMTIDPDATLRTNNRISTLFELTSGNDATWTGYIGASAKHTPKTATLADNDKIVFYYYDGLAPRPDWDALSALIATPNPVRTPAQRLNDLLAAELTFDKIKGTNAAADHITANLALPSKLDADLMSQPNFTVTWASGDTKYISDSGVIQARPRSGEEAVPVTMTATVAAGSACRLQPKDKREMTIIQPEQIGKYLNAAEEWGVLPMFYLELTSGLRRGELLAFLWTDVDVGNQTITVTKSVNRINGALKVSTPKTENSIHTVSIPQQAVDLLVEEHERHPESPYLFPSPVTGTMYGPECVGRIHKKLLKKAGIKENIRFHDLRHTFATLALQNGVDIKTLSSMLGHHSAGFTLDTYTHVTAKMHREAAEKMGGFMSQAM